MHDYSLRSPTLQPGSSSALLLYRQYDSPAWPEVQGSVTPCSCSTWHCMASHGATQDRTYRVLLAPLQFAFNSRSRCSTIRSADFPSHFGGIAPCFHCPVINRVSAGGSLLGSVPMSSFVPMVMVSGRSVLSRRVRPSKNRRFFPRSIVSLPPPYR